MTDEQRIHMLDILEGDPHVSPEDVAVRLGLEPGDVEAEIRRLGDEGVIRAYRTIVDWDRIGGPKVYAFVDVRTSPEPDFGFDAIARRLALFDEVHSLYLVSGGRDLLVVVEGRDFREVALFVAEKLAPLKGVESTATSFVLRKYKVDGHLLMGPQEDTRLAVAP